MDLNYYRKNDIYNNKYGLLLGHLPLFGPSPKTKLRKILPFGASASALEVAQSFSFFNCSSHVQTDLLSGYFLHLFNTPIKNSPLPFLPCSFFSVFSLTKNLEREREETQYERTFANSFPFLSPHFRSTSSNCLLESAASILRLRDFHFSDNGFSRSCSSLVSWYAHRNLGFCFGYFFPLSFIVVF